MGRRRRRGPLGQVEWLVSTVAKYLGYYTTAVKLAQLVPVAAGFAIVLFSPTAWLSGTLRTWAYVATAVGSVAGMGTLAFLVARDRTPRRLGLWWLVLFAGAGAILRLHLATIDIGFVERWSVLRPVQDFYLGSDTGELVFNLVAAVWFGVTVFAATVGLPLFVRERQRSEGVGDRDSTVAERAARVRVALDVVTEELARVHQELADMHEENRSLREDNVRLRERLAERPSGTGESGDAPHPSQSKRSEG